MSRSYKKNLIITDNQKGCTKQAKRKATRKVRDTPNDEITNGNSYKKISESWDICDWKIAYHSESDFKKLNIRDKWKVKRK